MERVPKSTKGMPFAFVTRKYPMFLKRKVQNMIMKTEISLTKQAATLLVVCLLAPSNAAGADAVPENESDQVAAAYQEWIYALETGSSNTHWEFPFDAPRPDDLSSKEMKTVLSLRRLSRSREMESLSTLTEIVARRQDEIPVQMRFWLAYSQGILQQNEACRNNLRFLLLVPGGHGHLETGQQAWVLTAFADYSFLLKKRDRAAQLYGQLAASSVEQVNLWGQYQLAGMEFLKRNFNDANRRYKVVCESEKSGSWREHACAMAEIAGRLNSLDLKGESHGRVAIVSP